MALEIPTYPNPFADDLEDAYAWIGFLAIEFNGTPKGRLVLNIHPSSRHALANRPPIVQRELFLGREGFPSFDALMTDPDFHLAFGIVRQKLYDACKGLPEFADAVDAP